MSKPYQLRVRIDGELHQKLTERLASGPGKLILSDLVRDALEAYLNPSAAREGQSLISASRQTQDHLRQLSERLERREDHVLEDCVQGIIDSFEENKVPLIVQELRLRQDFFSNVKS